MTTTHSAPEKPTAQRTRRRPRHEKDRIRNQPPHHTTVTQSNQMKNNGNRNDGNKINSQTA